MYLDSKRIVQLESDEIRLSLFINLISTFRFCSDTLVTEKPKLYSEVVIFQQHTR